MEQPSITYSVTQSVNYLGQTHNQVGPKTLKCSPQYQKKREQCLTNVAQTQSSSYVPRYNRFLQNRKIQRKIRHARMTNSYTLNYIIHLPRQNTNKNSFADQIFNGIDF
ncbi:hypothetical protein C1646_758911 [Rhizophagus diaphanus]|nr:hypothetical protein C1646_758911 [Rhizophagus diaphanus] [Rhizophagus sp. MUCL 43196]